MKKILFVFVMIIGMVFSANAQRDGFFGGNEGNDGARELAGPNIGMPQQGIGSTNNESAPLTGGLLIFSILGAGYAATKTRKS